MSQLPHIAGLLTSALLVAGCELVYPYGSTRGGQPDARSADARTADAARPDDRGAADETGRPLDGHGPLPDSGGVDAGVDACLPPPTVPAPPAGACIDGESSNLVQCAPCAPAHDVDCDGLMADASHAQDPWPVQHNTLWLGDGLTSEPFLARWDASTPMCETTPSLIWNDVAQTLETQGCARLVLAPTCAAAFADPDYLIELRFTVTKIDKPYAWSIALYLGEGGGMSRYCRFAQESGVAAGDPHVQVSALGLAQYEPIPALNPAASQIEGQTFLLQAYSYRDLPTGETRHHCRLLRGDGTTLFHDAAVATMSPASGATPVRIEATNVDLSLDHVRAHDVVDQAP